MVSFPTVEEGVVSVIVTILLATLVVAVAARLVLDRASFFGSLLTAVLGTLLATLVAGLVGGLETVGGLLLGLAAWALVAAVFLRTRWLKGAAVGIVAGVLWWLVGLAVQALL